MKNKILKSMIIGLLMTTSYSLSVGAISSNNEFNTSSIAVMSEVTEISSEMNYYNSYINNIPKYKKYIKNQNSKLTNEQIDLIISTVLEEMENNKNIKDPQLILAQINQESTFNPRLKCGAQDTGLLQIIPDTGKEIARKMNIENYYDDMRLDIKWNIKMGMWYLNNILEQTKKYTNDYETQVNLALCTYNAGPRALYHYKNTNELYNEYYQHVLKRYNNIEAFI